MRRSGSPRNAPGDEGEAVPLEQLPSAPALARENSKFAKAEAEDAPGLGASAPPIATVRAAPGPALPCVRRYRPCLGAAALADARARAQVAGLVAVVLAAGTVSHLANPPLPDGREFSEAAWYSVDVVKFSQRVLSDFDDVLSFVSTASNPGQILHRVVPLLAFVIGPKAALKVLVAYVAADVSNLDPRHD